MAFSGESLPATWPYPPGRRIRQELGGVNFKAALMTFGRGKKTISMY